MLAARDRHDYGDPSFTHAELLARWRTGGFSPGEDSVLAEIAGQVAGYAGVFNVGALAFVDPGHEGLGIGTELLAWTERRQREVGAEMHRQRAASTNARASALLGAAGYANVRTVWQMVTTLPVHLEAPAPPGVGLKPIDPNRDAEALHAADEMAFAQNPDFVSETLEDFRTEHLGSEQLDLEASVIARRDGAIAGYAFCQRLPGGIGYIDLLAVVESERGRGLGAALVAHALSAFAHAGLREARLEAASDNPRALRLYERAGMTRRHGAAIWEKPIAA
jgi:ribosomal protein S18 acetylase RimI-like enzyme